MRIIRPSDIGDTQLVSSNIPENDEPVYSSITNYSAGDRVIVTTGYHEIYEALKSTTNEFPPDNTTGASPAWLKVQSTNRWSMFDGTTTTSTDNSAGNIVVSLDDLGVINSLALFGLSGSSVTIVMTDPTDGVVYNETISLVDNSVVNDWYTYYFEPIEAREDITILDLPTYGTATLDITVTGTTTSCSLCVPGLSKKVGDLRYGSDTGITDYSIKETDQFGNFFIQERRFSKRANFSVLVDTSEISSIQKLLTSYRTTPAVWVGEPTQEETIIYGYYRDFSMVISGPRKSDMTLEIEGL